MLCSDASNSGWAGVLSLPAGSKTTRDYWCPEEKAVPIALREAKALHNTLVAFASDIFNTRVDAYVDNMNLLNFWNNEGGKNLSLTDEIKTLFLLCLNLNVSLNLYYLPSKCMPADAPSRFSSDIDCCLSESSWRLVDRTFGPHTVDMMAIPSNVRADSQGHSLKFFSPFPCEGSSGINVFSQQLSPAEIYYIFPPFVLIGPLLKFLLPCQAPTTIVIPGVYKTWPTPLAYLLAHSWLTFGLPVAYLLAYLWPTLGLPLAHLFVDSLCSNVKTRLSSNSNLPPRSVARPMPHHADPALRVAVCSVSKVCINFSFYSLITITR